MGNSLDMFMLEHPLDSLHISSTLKELKHVPFVLYYMGQFLGPILFILFHSDLGFDKAVTIVMFLLVHHPYISTRARIGKRRSSSPFISFDSFREEGRSWSNELFNPLVTFITTF